MGRTAAARHIYAASALRSSFDDVLRAGGAGPDPPARTTAAMLLRFLLPLLLCAATTAALTERLQQLKAELEGLTRVGHYPWVWWVLGI